MSDAPPSGLRWRLLRGYLRRELPGWGWLYTRLGGNDERRWRNAGIVELRGKLDGYRVPLDLSNWSERLSWFLGRYHDLPLLLALRASLRPGDAFVDIGANLGMLALPACRLVGPAGSVLACEPNPALAQRLERLARDNGIAELRVAATALGSAPGQAELMVFDGHSGWGSLVAAAPDGRPTTSQVSVPVSTGDALLADHPAERPLVLKIDVEGFEVPALHGLRQTIARHRPLIFIEAVEDHQRRAGHSLAELRGELEPHGYRGYCLAVRRAGLSGQRLEFSPFRGDPEQPPDVLYVPADGPLRARVAELLPRGS